MLTVTDKAAQYLRESLVRKEQGAPEALRIVQTEDAYQLTLDNPKDGDQVFEQEGQNYLLLDEHTGEALSDATLDVHESPHGLSLTLTAGG
jgi:Fe-S cluster assembly iron-binding protein IscA